MAEEYRLTRTGDAPLKFKGELVAEASGKIRDGQDQNRWHEIAVYKTSGGKYVLKIAYYTMWQGEDDYHLVIVNDTITGVVTFLQGYDPLEHLIGYPLGAQYSEKQVRLEDSLRQRWAVLVTEVLGEIPEAVEEIE